MNWHAGQQRAWDSEKRIVAIIAGHQSGKTEVGPHWLYREIRRRGPGDYIIASPTFQLLMKKVLPAFKALFENSMRLGDYKSQTKTFEFSRNGFRRTFGENVPYELTQVFFGHASDADSLESATAKAAWLDEAGQNKFKLDSFEAIQRRLSIHTGRTLITTTPYNLGWLKQKIFDPWLKAGRDHPDFEVVNFDSIANPAFPREEYEGKRRTLPAWKFNLFYRGIFERPAGAIFDQFSEKYNVCPRTPLPDHWPRYVGMDFGATNTAAVFLAAELNQATKVPTGRLIAYREYHPGKMPPEMHVAKILEGEPRMPLVVGGNPQEEEWRARFRAAGLPVLEPPTRDVEVGIDAVYKMLVTDIGGRPQLQIMDHLSGVLDQVASYSRVVDEFGEKTDEIEDKQLFHFCDSLRYLCVWIDRAGLAGFQATRDQSSPLADAPPGVFHDLPDERPGRIGGGSYTATFPEF